MAAVFWFVSASVPCWAPLREPTREQTPQPTDRSPPDYLTVATSSTAQPSLGEFRVSVSETKQQETTEQGEFKDRKLLIKVTSAPTVAGRWDSRRPSRGLHTRRQSFIVRHLTHGQTFGDGCEKLCTVCGGPMWATSQVSVMETH